MGPGVPAGPPVVPVAPGIGPTGDPTSIVPVPMAPATGPLADATDSLAAPPARPRWRRPLQIGVAAAGVLLLAGIGWFVYRGVTGKTGGASSPEAAAQQLVDALAKEDPVAAAAVIDPEEVRTLGDVLSTVEKRLASAGLDRSAGDAAGVDLTLDDVTFRTRDLGDHTAMVEITGGRGTWRVDPAEVAERTAAIGVDARSETFTRDDLIVDGSNEHGDFRVEPHLIAIERDGGWYLSISNTVASYLVETQNLPAGDHRTEPPSDLGASDSPEDAVIDLLEHSGEYDPEVALRSLPSDEWSTLWTYRAALRTWRDREQPKPYTATVDRHDVDVTKLGGGLRKVEIRSASGTSTVDGDRQTWQLDGWCLTTDGSRTCFDEDAGLVGRPATYGITRPFVVVTEDRGGWVVSPTATLLEYARIVADHADDDLVYRMTDLRAAPPTGTITLGRDTEITLNDAGFAVRDVALQPNVPLTISFSNEDAEVRLVSPDGTWEDRWGAVTVDRAGTYRVIVAADDAGVTGTLHVAEIPVRTLDGSIAAGTLDNATPVVDFSFRVPTTGDWTYTSSGNGDTWASFYDSDRGNGLGCDALCTLQAGTTYHLRVTSNGDGSEAFRYEIAPAATATIDGTDEVSGYVGYNSTSTHQIEIGSGVTATIRLEGSSSGDLDVRCTGGLPCNGSENSGSSETMTMTGPASGAIEVYGYNGSTGSYTATISTDG